MPKRKRSARIKLNEKQLLAESKKVLRKAERTLKMELTEVKRYIKALGAHNPFPL